MSSLKESSSRTKFIRFETTKAPEKDAVAKESVPIVTSLLAAFAGMAGVSATAASVESATADSCLPFDSKGQRFNQDEFAGRFCRMILACDPYLLFYTAEQVFEAKALLEKSDDHKDDRSMDRTLWEAKRVVDAALHPDTGEFIPRPFRMSGYVPFNGPICVSMIASTSTIPLLFWSWANQSQNALSYSVAVGSALVVAFGLATFIQKKYPAEKAKSLMKFVAFPSAIIASSLNCYIVRSPEIETGITLTDKEGKDVLEGETSSEAAKRGVYSTTLSRALLQAPVYFFPPLLLGGPFRKIVTRNPGIRVPMTTFLTLTSFGIGLPATVAIFPQIEGIAPAEVESKFQGLRDPKTQKPYTVYYYNKGL
eukprot:scaffold2816_cov121-Cylindrotheca_fusiformis.AAC.49